MPAIRKSWSSDWPDAFFSISTASGCQSLYASWAIPPEIWIADLVIPSLQHDGAHDVLVAKYAPRCASAKAGAFLGLKGCIPRLQYIFDVLWHLFAFPRHPPRCLEDTTALGAGSLLELPCCCVGAKRAL
jgi:hypothetical protein